MFIIIELIDIIYDYHNYKIYIANK
jgi:hypothetical protein